MKHRIHPLTTTLAAAALLGAAALGGCDATNQPTGPNEHVGDPNANPGNNGDVAITSLGLRFEVIGDTETECGEAAGVRVQIAREGDTQECTAMWAPAFVSAPFTGGAGDHHVADCLFVVTPGEWNVTDVAAVGEDGQPLACCAGDWPAKVTVAQSETTEIGVDLSCDTLASGALDIYGWLNLPPYINDVIITPSKFGPPCVPITLEVVASDPNGDTVTYDWMVIEAPEGVGYTLEEDGPTAIFTAEGEGSFTIRVEVTDGPGSSTHLDFPLHIVGEVEGDACEVGEALAAIQTQMVDGADPAAAGSTFAMSSVFFNEAGSTEALTQINVDYILGGASAIPSVPGLFAAGDVTVYYEPSPVVDGSGQVAGVAGKAASELIAGDDYVVTTSTMGAQSIVFLIDLPIGHALYVSQSVDVPLGTPTNDYGSTAVWTAIGATSGSDYAGLAGETTTVAGQ